MLSLQPCERVEEVTLWSQLQPGWMTDQSTYIVPKVNLVDYQLHAPSHTLKSSKTVAPWSRKKKRRLVLVPLTSLFKDASQHVPLPINLKNLSIIGYEQFDRRFFFFFTAKWILNVVSPFYADKQLFYFHLVERNCPANRSHKGISIFFFRCSSPYEWSPEIKLVCIRGKIGRREVAGLSWVATPRRTFPSVGLCPFVWP